MGGVITSCNSQVIYPVEEMEQGRSESEVQWGMNVEKLETVREF